MRIEVTQRHIDEGIPAMGYSCAIALALNDANLGEAVVSVRNTWVRHRGREVAVRLPPEAQQFVDDFDNQRPVRPFAFEIQLPE